MAHEIAKLMLEHASTFLDRREAIKTAVSLGMPLHEIEEYLDWLDFVRAQSSPRHASGEKNERSTTPSEADVPEPKVV